MKKGDPHYKLGKQKGIMPLAVWQACMQDAANQGVKLEWLAYVTLVHYFGCRKSEGYERPLSDVTVTKKFVVVDFHERKKHGLREDPNETPREWYGVEEFLIPWIKKRQNSKPPHRKTWKNIFRQVETDKTRVTPSGKTVTIKKTVGEKKRDIWLFPHIQSHTAWTIYKKVYGEKYYPHYDRLWRLTQAGRTTDNPIDCFAAIQRVSGLKTWGAAQAYFGRSKQIEKTAMHTLKEEKE